MAFFFRPNIGSFTVSSKSPFQLDNAGLSVSVAASALTIALKQLDGSSDATAIAPINIAFRSGTLTSGAINKREITSSLSITVPSGATLGHTSAVAGLIYVYAVDNSGTISLAVSSQPVNENELQSVTAITTGSDTLGTLYGTALSSKPVRLLGRLVSTQTTAGTWDAAPTEVSIVAPGWDANFESYPWEAWTPTGSWSTNTTYTGYKRRVGQNLEGMVLIALSGAPEVTSLTVTLPDSLSSDSTVAMSSGSYISPVGIGEAREGGGSGYYIEATLGASATTLAIRTLNVSATYPTRISVTSALPFAAGSSDFYWFNFSVPILGWSA